MPELFLWHWFAFAGLVVLLLTLDLVVFHRHDHTPSLRESAWWTVFWIGLAVIFNGVIWWWGGHMVGVAFLSAYLIEKSLSIDNIFVFVVIFRFFHIPLMYQYRVLFWGILGAVVMRLLFILAGVELIHRFEWVVPIFGAFLIYTGLKLARHSGGDMHPQQNIVLRTARRLLRVTRGDHHQHGHHFFVRENGHLCLTPMFLVLLVIESTDVLFALDSVPAVIGIIPKSFAPAMMTFIAFTSNVFAILGLRALYFLLAGVIDMFRYLHYGLAAVLGFVGVKMIAEFWVPHQGAHLLSPWASLAVVASLITISVLASILASRRERARAASRQPAAGSGQQDEA